jgi:hypothetical protein
MKNALKNNIMTTSINHNANAMMALQDVYLTKVEFSNDLETCLTILKYPSKKSPYYVCEHVSAALVKRRVKIFIKTTN